MKLRYLFTLLLPAFIASACSGEGGITPGAGRGGSMAQFTVYNGQLYLLQSDKLDTYSLQNPAAPQKTSSTSIGFDAETLFPTGGNLFIGSQSGMHIFSLENPLEPAFISTYQHVTSCDPVVVEGNYAYVTLRSGSPCRFGTNELQVIDISEPSSPQLINQMFLQNPQGLAVNEGTLFVCNGSSGLVALDVSVPGNPVLLKEYQDYHGYDVIYTTKSLMMIGEDGLVQYDPRDPANLKQLSVIPVAPVVQ